MQIAAGGFPRSPSHACCNRLHPGQVGYIHTGYTHESCTTAQGHDALWRPLIQSPTGKLDKPWGKPRGPPVGRPGVIMHPSEPADVDEGHRGTEGFRHWRQHTHGTNKGKKSGWHTLARLIRSRVFQHPSLPVPQHPSLTRRHEQFRPPARCRQVS